MLVLPSSSTTPSMPGSNPPQKLRSSCDNCHLAKVKCISTADVQCTRCNKHALRCIYSPSLRMGKPRGARNHRRGSSVASTSARLMDTQSYTFGRSHIEQEHTVCEIEGQGLDPLSSTNQPQSTICSSRCSSQSTLRSRDAENVIWSGFLTDDIYELLSAFPPDPFESPEGCSFDASAIPSYETFSTTNSADTWNSHARRSSTAHWPTTPADTPGILTAPQTPHTTSQSPPDPAPRHFPNNEDNPNSRARCSHPTYLSSSLQSLSFPPRRIGLDMTLTATKSALTLCTAALHCPNCCSTADPAMLLLIATLVLRIFEAYSRHSVSNSDLGLTLGAYRVDAEDERELMRDIALLELKRATGVLHHWRDVAGDGQIWDELGKFLGGKLSELIAEVAGTHAV